MDRSIVCAVDDDEDHARPLSVAADLAERLDRPLVVAHVATPELLGAAYPVAAPGLPIAPLAPTIPAPAAVEPNDEEADDPRHEHRRARREWLRQLVDRSGFHAARVEVVIATSVVDGLRRLSHKHRAELLVVGSRGHGSTRAALLGSTPHDVLSEAPCPVVVVPVDR